jgi:hypothetical protein
VQLDKPCLKTSLLAARFERKKKKKNEKKKRNMYDKISGVVIFPEYLLVYCNFFTMHTINFIVSQAYFFATESMEYI